MAIKERHDMVAKFKKGNLYLCNLASENNYFTKIPVVALSKNKKYKHFATWLCLLPNGSTGGFHPNTLKDITLEKGYQ